MIIRERDTVPARGRVNAFEGWCVNEAWETVDEQGHGAAMCPPRRTRGAGAKRGTAN